ncbi:MAG: redox-regulated ATPase YchF [Thermodesulfobacteriota bacterium]|nr:redox-regulated ATPase YchF [Thermodesulfobacteriota bacterium]
MKIGLIGLQNSGKTTIFNALTKSEAEVTEYAGKKAEPNMAVVNVIDERVTRLSSMYKPKKTVYATIEFIDFVLPAKESERSDIFSSASMGLIKNTDALAIVVRNFQDNLMGEPDPLNDINQINDELLLSDLIITENRLERIELSYKRGQKTNELQLEEKTLRKISEQLNNNRSIRDIHLSDYEEKSLRGFQFLTKKPIMIVLNSGEENFRGNENLLAEIKKKHKVIEFTGNFEMELSRLDDDEAKMFMEDMGIDESARNRLTKFAYDIVGYISFFTVGSDEVRAWNIHNGETAVEAAGTIHTDLSRGFIRAECFSYDNLIECGSEKAVREKGLFRLEGKDYIVQDGDILNIRFNI